MEIHVNETIVMRSRTTADAPEVYQVIDTNRAYLRQWLPWVDNTAGAETTHRVIEKWEKERESGTDTVLGIIHNNAYVGNIGLHDINMGNKSGMIGYWLAEHAQGGGIMTACVSAMLAYGFDTLNLNRIYIHCATPNKKSRAIPERLGFTLEGILRDEECLYGRFFDLAVYGLLRREYETARQSVKV